MNGGVYEPTPLFAERVRCLDPDDDGTPNPLIVEEVTNTANLIPINTKGQYDNIVEYGGLLLAVDADGGKEVGWPWHDTKLWWPHTAALYVTLLAYEHSREGW